MLLVRAPALLGLLTTSAAIATATLAPWARADSYARSCPLDVYSENGRYKAHLEPDGQRAVFDVSSGDDSYLYSLDFYGPVEITSDGRFVIRHGPWASGFMDLALAFYRDGRLLREYRVRDLVRDFSRVDQTASHFEWKADVTSRAVGLSPDESTYSLATVDRLYYVFDIRSGQIRAAGTDSTARNAWETTEEWEANRVENAQRVLAATRLPETLAPHFQIRKAFLSRKGVGLKVELAPAPALCGVTIAAVFDLSEPERMRDVEPSRFYDAARTICGLRFVRSRMDRESGGHLTLHFRGSKPYWFESNVRRIREALAGSGIETSPIAHWASATLDSPSEPSLYFHHLLGDGRSVIGHSILRDSAWGPKVRAEAAELGVPSLTPEHLGYVLGPPAPRTFAPIAHPTGVLELVDVGTAMNRKGYCQRLKPAPFPTFEN